jgi:dTDP-4-dehydrorhamnose reductase
MRILLTGTNGQVGGALHPLLAGRNTVLAPARNAFDLSQPDTLVAALDRLRPELIVNPAAYTAVDKAEDERDLAYRVNAEAPQVMMRWAVQNGVPMVHFSTDYVFDGSGTEPWREDSEPRPLSVYGASKLAGDQAVIAAGGAHLIVRTSWVYAVKGKNFLTTVLRLAREREELRVVADQFGAPTSAIVIAEIVGKILDVSQSDFRLAFGRSGGVLNVTCSGETSWHGFAVAIINGLREQKIDLKVRHVVPIGSGEFPAKTRRPANSRLGLENLRQQFGLVPKLWSEALRNQLDRIVSV